MNISAIFVRSSGVTAGVSSPAFPFPFPAAPSVSIASVTSRMNLVMNAWSISGVTATSRPPPPPPFPPLPRANASPPVADPLTLLNARASL